MDLQQAGTMRQEEPIGTERAGPEAGAVLARHVRWRWLRPPRPFPCRHGVTASGASRVAPGGAGRSGGP